MAQRDDKLQEILSRLTSIAEALTGDTPPPRTPSSQEQSQTITDYLVLREAVGRKADEKSRVIGAERRVGGVIAFADADPLEDETRIAVFTERGLPSEVRQLDPQGTPQQVAASSTNGGSTERTVTLQDVDDDQPIIRIEVRDGDGRAIALGPRLLAVA